MGRLAGSIVTLVLFVLLVAAGTAPAEAAVRGGSANDQAGHHHQRDGDRGPDHRTGRHGRPGPDDRDRERDRRDRDDGGRQDRDGTADRAGDRLTTDTSRARGERDRDDRRREDRNRDPGDRDDRDRDHRDREDDEPQEREARNRRAPHPERERDAPRSRGDAADDRGGNAPRERRVGAGQSDDPGGDRPQPRAPRADTDRAPSRAATRTAVDDVTSAQGSASTTEDRDTGTTAGSGPDPTPPPDPRALRTLGLGGYVVGDFGWFGGRASGGPAIGVPGGGVPATIGGLPVLLALLGAFLALQRGIGQGLGHVPMDATSTGPETHGHH